MELVIIDMIALRDIDQDMFPQFTITHTHIQWMASSRK